MIILSITISGSADDLNIPLGDGTYAHTSEELLLHLCDLRLFGDKLPEELKTQIQNAVKVAREQEASLPSSDDGMKLSDYYQRILESYKEPANVDNADSDNPDSAGAQALLETVSNGFTSIATDTYDTAKAAFKNVQNKLQNTFKDLNRNSSNPDVVNSSDSVRTQQQRDLKENLVSSLQTLKETKDSGADNDRRFIRLVEVLNNLKALEVFYKATYPDEDVNFDIILSNGKRLTQQKSLSHICVLLAC